MQATDVQARPKFPATQAAVVARLLVGKLEKHCERIQVAGSLRRKKEQVGDIEILFIPKFGDIQHDFFQTEHVDLAERFINQWVETDYLAKRKNKLGSEIWGPKNKLAVHLSTGIPVDFFSTTPENWWVSLVIRTGPKELNIKLTTGAQRLGRTLNAYGCGVTESDGTVIQATSEEHVFELCGVPYLKPEER